MQNYQGDKMRFDDLSFVNFTNGVRNNWSVGPRLDYAEDCLKGASYFHDLKRVVDETGNLQLIQYVMQDMIRGGEVGGIEVGFLTALSASLV